MELFSFNDVAVGFFYLMALLGGWSAIFALIEALQNRVNAYKHINEDVPVLKDTVERLETRLSRLEIEAKRRSPLNLSDIAGKDVVIIEPDED